MASQTLYDKLWNAHEVTKRDDGSNPDLYRSSLTE